MHPLFQKADKLSTEIIGAAMEVHSQKDAGLIESIYEKCLLRELELRKSEHLPRKKWILNTKEPFLRSF